MIVDGLKRDASTSRSRSWLIDQRLPAPARSGARSPWNLVSGNGPEWHRMQVLERSSTKARPRDTSPAAPVSETGMPSPTTAYRASSCACAAWGRAQAAATYQARWIADLAKAIHRNRLEPRLRILRFAGAQLARRIDGADAAALDLDEDAVLWLIVAGERKRVTRRDRAVADAGQFRYFRRLARGQVYDRRRAGCPLRVRGRCRFRNAATEAGVANDMDIGHQRGGKCH